MYVIISKTYNQLRCECHFMGVTIMGKGVTDTKRKKGTGTITKLDSGNYRIMLRFKDSAGKTHTISETVPNKTIAEARLKELGTQVKELKQEVYYEFDELSIKDYTNKFFLPYKKKALKESSYTRLESTFRTHIFKESGTIAMKNLTAEDINKHIDKLFNEGMSHSSIKKVYDGYAALFKFAKDKRGDVRKSPISATNMISENKFQRQEIKWLNREEIRLLKACCDKRTTTGKRLYKYGAVFMLMLNTGIREGEMCALEKSDIDFDKRTLSITKTASANSREKGYKVAITSPKTRRSERYVPLNNEAIKYINELMEEFPQTEYLISTYKNEVVRPTTLVKQFKNLLSDNKMEERGLHALRHTFVSMLFDKEVDTNTIASIIGDSEETVRKTYLHLTNERRAMAVNAIELYDETESDQ